VLRLEVRIKTNRFIIIRKVTNVYCENGMKHTNTLCQKEENFLMLGKLMYLLSLGFKRLRHCGCYCMYHVQIG
jgi:hypothetical protein